MSIQSKFNALELLTRIRAANALIPDGQPSGDSIHAIRSPEILGNRNIGNVRNKIAYEEVVNREISSPLVGQSACQNRAPSSTSGVSNTQSVTDSFSPFKSITNTNIDDSKKYGSKQQTSTIATSSTATGENEDVNRRFNVPDQPFLLNSPVYDDFVMRYKDTYDLEDDRNVRNRRNRIGYDSLLQYNQDISQNIPDCKNQNQNQKVKNNAYDQNKQSMKSDSSYEERFAPIENNLIFNKNRSNPMIPNYLINSDAGTIPYNTPYNIPYDCSDIRNNSLIAAEIFEELNKLRIDNTALNRKIRMITIQKSEIERHSRETKIKNDDIIASLRCKLHYCVRACVCVCGCVCVCACLCKCLSVSFLLFYFFIFLLFYFMLPIIKIMSRRLV